MILCFDSFSNLLKKNSHPRVSAASPQGFSITEILIALGLVAIIAAGLAAVMSSAAKQQKGIQAKD